jgi:hypothetical protein
MQEGFIHFCVHMEAVETAKTLCTFNMVSFDLFKIVL